MAKPLWEGKASRKDKIHAKLCEALVVEKVTCPECHRKYKVTSIMCGCCKTLNPYHPTMKKAADDVTI